MNKQLYKCDCCENEFHSGRPRYGERLCSDCSEIRRKLLPYAKKLDVGRVLARAGKLLLPYAEK